jgi:hypothetical protein
MKIIYLNVTDNNDYIHYQIFFSSLDDFINKLEDWDF